MACGVSLAAAQKRLEYVPWREDRGRVEGLA
jgi:hypothetical protein